MTSLRERLAQATKVEQGSLPRSQQGKSLFCDDYDHILLWWLYIISLYYFWFWSFSSSRNWLDRWGGEWPGKARLQCLQVHSTQYTVQNTHYTAHSLQNTLYTQHGAVSTQYTVQLQCVHCTTMYNVHLKLRIQRSSELRIYMGQFLQGRNFGHFVSYFFKK